MYIFTDTCRFFELPRCPWEREPSYFQQMFTGKRVGLSYCSSYFRVFLRTWFPTCASLALHVLAFSTVFYRIGVLPKVETHPGPRNMIFKVKCQGHWDQSAKSCTTWWSISKHAKTHLEPRRNMFRLLTLAGQRIARWLERTKSSVLSRTAEVIGCWVRSSNMRNRPKDCQTLS